MFKRILIANRGEIACRIARTCARLGIEYVSVFSSADAASPHLDGAVATACLGDGPAQDSYLNIAGIITAAREHGCDAVHPGYGFLSENPGFATAVAQAGLAFIGPRADTIAALGDKARAKALMRAAGVPTVPGTDEAIDDPVRLAAMVRATGLPVLLKPTAGGGGKGMHVIRTGEGLDEAIGSAIRVARSSFGDGRLIVEKFIERPRHIEVQIFGDRHGSVVHLFDRECSLQRRHQKVIEEAPSLGLDETMRARLLEAAVRGAQSIGYINAGTFEFIVSQEQQFYFLEVNTRLQVEHPVTEAITGLDLVEWQIRIAAGERLPRSQADIRASGHAVECRVYAEDPANGFRPAPGRVDHVRWPAQARVDAGIRASGAVPPFYDPMVAKLITHAATREDALAGMRGALRDTVLLGLTTNLGYLRRILEDPAVAAGDIHTGYLDTRLADLAAPGDTRLAAACAAAASVDTAAAGPWSARGCAGPMDRAALNPDAPLGETQVRDGGTPIGVMLVARRGERLALRVGEWLVETTLAPAADGLRRGELGPLPWTARLSEETVAMQIGGDGYCLDISHDDTGRSLLAPGAARAPMPGVITLLSVKAGDTVQAGTTLAVVEAMKMENRVLADVDGLVRAVRYAVGDHVDAGDLLIELEPL
ncbi:carbamoyl-phosphate synthase subunit L [Pigmentiphaga sp. NML080357]|uniref:acetyl/propionyl/methylcrotonyl-CoA carboxylase subunit alpha n=1 Tax=Pigmentiphaga sp. NML080357 TaxID=2008675 RepID=UPI000B421C90|nr:biotin carboxylase N-terminal domain-containing protein [Pigmentiphaga sp. NML080357]OVZ59427.1 carbamoyl-phosphate synthase subunit L [Pigmentiphaga sp. NML080357]